MSAFLIVMTYVVLFYAGSRKMRANRHYRDVVWYLIGLGCCTYLSLGNVYEWPSVQRGFPFSDILLSIGKQLQHWLGGPPHE